MYMCKLVKDDDEKSHCHGGDNSADDCGSVKEATDILEQTLHEFYIEEINKFLYTKHHNVPLGSEGLSISTQSHFR